MLIVTFNVTNNNPETIYNKLATKLGRTPTNEEVRKEVQRIIASVKVSK